MRVVFINSGHRRICFWDYRLTIRSRKCGILQKQSMLDKWREWLVCGARVHCHHAGSSRFSYHLQLQQRTFFFEIFFVLRAEFLRRLPTVSGKIKYTWCTASLWNMQEEKRFPQTKLFNESPSSLVASNELKGQDRQDGLLWHISWNCHWHSYEFYLK